MKYYYNLTTKEYCGTTKPLGDNFGYTKIKPNATPMEDESLIFDEDSNMWVIDKLTDTGDPHELDNLREERVTLIQEMQYHLLLGNQEEAKAYAERISEIDHRIKEIQEELNE